MKMQWLKTSEESGTCGEVERDYELYVSPEGGEHVKTGITLHTCSVDGSCWGELYMDDEVLDDGNSRLLVESDHRTATQVKRAASMYMSEMLKYEHDRVVDEIGVLRDRMQVLADRKQRISALSIIIRG